MKSMYATVKLVNDEDDFDPASSYDVNPDEEARKQLSL